MLNKKLIILLIKIFLTVIFFHFLITTYLKFSIGYQSPLINLRKDIFIIIIYLLICIYSFGINKFNLKKYFLNKNHFYLSLLIILFSIIGIIVSVIQNIGIKQLILGIKYDILILLPLIFFPILKLTPEEFKNILDYFIQILKYIIYLSLFFWIIRFMKPGSLRYLGFGDNTEYVPNQKPPLYYKTKDLRGSVREQGIFSGPNNLAFFGVAFLPIIYAYATLLKRKFGKISVSILIIILFLIFLSFSRSGWMAIGLELLLLIFFSYRLSQTRVTKYLKIMSIVGFLILLVFMFLLWKFNAWYSIIIRDSSTQGHFNLMLQGIYMFIQNIRGYGLGSAGPSAVQLNIGIVPENWWIQIFLEVGLIGGINYILIFIGLIYSLYIQSNCTNQKYQINKKLNYFQIVPSMLIIGIIGLSMQGMLLHAFEDASISLAFFGIIGLYLGVDYENK